VSGTPWVQELRREARQHLRDRGLPTTREEDWKYTNVRPIARTEWVPGEPQPADLTREALEELASPVYACSLFVFVNGRFAPGLSTARAMAGGVRVRSLAAVLEEDSDAVAARLGGLADAKAHAFTAWNTAELVDGAVVEIPGGVDLEEPVHLVFLSEPGPKPTASHPRVLVLAGAGSRASVIEDYVSGGAGQTFTNPVSEFYLEANAQLEHVRFQREVAADSFHVSSVYARQERDSRLAATALTFGGSLVRNDVASLLAGEGAECWLRGAFLGTGTRHVDNHTLVDHAVPHTRSHELYKGILAGKSKGVFRGRVVVRPDAQRIEADQQNKNLLLSEGAEIDTKPQLEIHADDVKCSHGSTIGRLDPDALFYLRARGIAELEARKLLTGAFAADVTGALRFAPLRERAQEQLLEMLESA